MPDDVQPDEGQGGEAPGIFDPYLESVPEDARGTVIGYLKDAEKHVNSRVAEATQLQKQFGPYKDVEALAQYQPEQLAELLAWHQQVTSSDDAFRAWLAEAAEENGLTQRQEDELADAVEGGELTAERARQLVEEQTQAAIQPLQQQLQEWQTQRDVDTTEQEIHEAFKSIEKDNKVDLTEDQKAMILDLGMDYSGSGSWIAHGFERFQKAGAEFQKAFVEGKLQQPGSALTGGGSPAFKPTTDFNEAKAQARERWRQMQQ